MSDIKILVILKQIPDSCEKDFYQDTGCLNDSDINVITEALDLRDSLGGTVTVMAIGPTESLSILKEAYTYGVDHGILLDDDSWHDTDIRGAGRVAAAAAVYTGPYDLIMFGRQAIDGDSIHMAAMTAGYLGMPLLPYSNGLSVINHQIQAECIGDDQNEQVSADFPAVVLSVRKRNGRYPSVQDILKTYNGTFKVRVIDGCELVLDNQKKMVYRHRTYIPDISTQHKQIIFKEGDETVLACHLETVLCQLGY
ncbi:MAG: electron transfer flavoprotein subunit beta/FixA family protein [Coprococcus sp.]